MKLDIKLPKELSGLDAVRLLCNAIQKVQHFDQEGEGISPVCSTFGEYMLCDALEYLAYGDTNNARARMDEYDHWIKTGQASWIYNTREDPLSLALQLRHRMRQEEVDSPELPF